MYDRNGWFEKHLKRMVSVLMSPQLKHSGEIAIPAIWHIALPQRSRISCSLLGVAA